MAMQDGDTCQASAARMTPKMGVYNNLSSLCILSGIRYRFTHFSHSRRKLCFWCFLLLFLSHYRKSVQLIYPTIAQSSHPTKCESTLFFIFKRVKKATRNIFAKRLLFPYFWIDPSAWSDDPTNLFLRSNFSHQIKGFFFFLNTNFSHFWLEEIVATMRKSSSFLTILRVFAY